ncbi:unnamed protein product, partial [marine sediment metagenome]
LVIKLPGLKKDYKRFNPANLPQVTCGRFFWCI